jgi:hypothetical protein
MAMSSLVKKGVARAFGKDVLDARKRIDASVNDFVEGAEVGYDSNATIFLWNGERRSCPIGCTTWFEDTDLDKSVDFMSKHLLMVVCNGIRSRIDGLGVWIDFEVDFTMRIKPKLAREECWKLGEEFGKIGALFWSQVGLLVGDVFGVGPFILAFEDLLAHGVGVEMVGIDCSSRVVFECSSRARVVRSRLERYGVVEPTDLLFGAIDNESGCSTEVGAKDHVVFARGLENVSAKRLDTARWIQFRKCDIFQLDVAVALDRSCKC